MRAHPASALFLVLSASSLVGSNVAADTWRVDRHDSSRTGASTGSVPLASPSIAWRAYAGGSPNGANVRFGLGSPSGVVTSEGGRFVARNMITQSVLWKSPILGSGSVVELADLDGDQKKEVIVQTDEQAHVLDGSTGALLWSSPPDEIQIMGAVHVLDLDGDGLPDVYLDNGIGAKYGTTLAEAFSFSGGTGHKLWALPLSITPLSVNAGEDALMDLNGDGIPEVVLASTVTALVISGKDGSTIATLQPPSAPVMDYPYFEATALGAELDGQPGKEVLMVQHYSIASEWTMPGLAAYKLDVGTGQSQMLWAANVGTYDSELITTGDEASDLDGDGIAEVVMSYRAGTTWTTNVLDGATGQVIASVPDSRFEGAADLDGVPGEELIVSNTAGLSIYSLTGGNLVQRGASIGGARALPIADPKLFSAPYINNRIAIVPGPGDHPMLLAGVPVGSPGPFDRVRTFDSVQGFELLPSGTSSSLQQVGSYKPLVGSITGAIKADFATRPYEQIALGTSAGVVAVLNKHLAPTNGILWINGDPLGSFVGGTQAALPSLVAQDALGPFVLFPDTFLGAVAGDVRIASWILPPIPRWSRDNLTSASIVDLNGVTDVVGVEDHSLIARRADTGAQVGNVVLPLGSIRGTPVPLHVSGQPDRFVGVDWLVVGSHQVAQTKVDFTSQTVAWSAAPIQWAGFYGSSVGDLDNDGTDEWYTMEFGNLYKRDADAGGLTTIGTFPDLAYSMPILAPFQGTTTDILLQNGWGSPWLVGPDATPLWTTPGDGAPENAVSGARVMCNGVPRFVGPDLASPHLHSYDGPTGTLSADKVFAGGHAYATEQDAIAAGEHPGTMSNVNAVADLAGAPAAFAGSSDGYLYAVDPCTLDIRWAANIGASLDEPIVADVDGDGDDEIVVAATDGFIYGLDNPRFPAPLLSIDGDQGNDSVLVPVGASVSISWASVPGATQYEFALVGPDEKAVNGSSYQPASGSSASVSLDGALAGRPYRISVRGTSPAGPGLEALSKPVVINDVTIPSATVSATDGPVLSLAVDATDDVSLDHYELVVHDGATANVVDDGMLKGSHVSEILTWTAEKNLWGKDVTLDVNVFDSAGLRNQRVLSAHVGTDGSITTKPATAGDPTSGPEASGVPLGSQPPVTGASASGGCTVGSAAPSEEGLASAAALIGASLLLRRRSRSS